MSSTPARDEHTDDSVTINSDSVTINSDAHAVVEELREGGGGDTKVAGTCRGFVAIR